MVAEARQRLEEAQEKQIKAKSQTMKGRFKCLPIIQLANRAPDAAAED